MWPVTKLSVRNRAGVERRSHPRRRTVVIAVNTDFFFLSHRLHLATAAAAEGWRVIVVSADTGRSNEIREAGLEFVHVPFTRGSMSPLAELKSCVALWRVLVTFDPAVVHLVASKAILYGGLICRLRGRRSMLFSVTGAGFVLGGGRRRSFSSIAARALLRWIIGSRGSIAIFENHSDLNELGSAGRPTNIVMPGSGVDVRSWVVERPPEGDVVLMAARLFAEKGVREFAEAARRVSACRPGAHFVLVGEVDRGLPTAISEGEIRGWEKEGILTWWGFRRDMERVIASASVVVLPTYHREGAPQILQEAAAGGRPVVASDIPGCREIVVDRETGRLVPPRDVAALADAIIELCDDPALRLAFGAAARSRAEQLFDVAQINERTLTLYSVLAR